MRAPVIAIDGPVASGKSTVGQLLARKLGYFYLDSGILYRALTLKALSARISPEDEAALARLARELRVSISPPSRPDGRQCDVRIDGRDVTVLLRSPEVEKHVSAVSAHRAV